MADWNFNLSIAASDLIYPTRSNCYYGLCSNSPPPPLPTMLSIREGSNTKLIDKRVTQLKTTLYTLSLPKGNVGVDLTEKTHMLTEVCQAIVRTSALRRANLTKNSAQERTSPTQFIDSQVGSSFCFHIVARRVYEYLKFQMKVQGILKCKQTHIIWITTSSELSNCRLY